jgi:hypothetical protein
MSHEELEAARDYWAQIYERLSLDPMATLVKRDEAITQLAAGRHEAIADLYGFSPELTAKLKQQYVDDLKSAPVTSPGIDPHAEFIFANLCRRVEEACDKIEGLNARNVITGIEPRLGVFASRMGVILTNASIVTVGSQIFRFCNVVSKALAQTVLIDPQGWDNLDDTNALRKKVCVRSDVIAYWFQIIASFSMLGTSIFVPLKVPPPAQANLRSEILDALEIFAIAHEYAHHILKHGRLQSASSDTGKNDAARHEEFEADTLAIAISQLVTGNQLNENVLMLSGVGMVVFLHTLHMLDEARHLLGLRDGEVASHGSHPSAEDRLSYVDQQEWLWPHFDAQFRHFRRAYGNIMRIVWDELEPLFRQIGKNNPSLAKTFIALR